MEFYIPPAIYLIWAVHQTRRFGPWLQDPRYVREPGRRMWSLWRFFDDEAWTDEGQVMRGRFLRSMGIGVLLALGGVGVAFAIQAMR